MNENNRQYLSFIENIQPGLVIQSINFIDEGLVNDIVIINGETVFRFAKGENGVKALEAEMRVLQSVRPHVHLPIPDPFFTSREMTAYPLLKGESLTRSVLFTLSEPARMAVVEQMAAFLKEMHNAALDKNLPQTLAPVHYAEWMAIYRRVKDEIYPMLMKHQRAWAEHLFEEMLNREDNFHFAPKLIHGDLGCYHILFDPLSKQVSGVIDFGAAGIGDPANDFACLIQYYGESFVVQFREWYPEMDEQMLKRARFYAQAIEFEWMLNGLKSGKNFWFAAHIGNARDMGKLI